MEHHQGSSKPPVPKFSSFKPKPPPESPKTSESSPARPEARHNRPRAEQTPGDEGRDRVHRSRHSSKQHGNQERWHDHTEPRKQYRDNQRRAEERHHKRRYRSRSGSRSRSRNRNERHHASARGYESKPFREIKLQSGDREKDYFVVDRKGDQDNLVYGRLNRWSIPAYTRAGAGYVLGLSSDFRIDRLESDDKGIAVASKGHHGKAERRLLSRQHRTQDVPTLRLVKPMSDLQDEFDSTQDFIPVRSRKRKRGSEEPDMEGELIDYRSIEGKAKAKNALDDSDLEDANDLDGDSYQDFLTETKERNAMLTRKVQEEPHSLSAWLDLIEHQEAMIRIGSSDVHRQLKATERHALASLRLDIYERALKLINEERLVLGLMNESSKIHGREEHFKKWRQFLQEHPESTSLWIKYIDTLQTNLAEFRYENCHAKYLDCLRLLSSQGSRTNQNLRVYLLLRLTSMMRDAGYQERAVALWQALFEYQLCRPEETSLQDFEEFWESECPRMGEPASQGWAIHRQKGQWPDPPDSGTAVHDVVTDSKDLFRSFVKNERRLAEVFEFPGRTIDEAGEEDPFHVVLFNDIQSELELLQDQIPPVMLVEAYLCFWGLPPLVTSELETRKWWLDPFLRHEKLDCCEYETLPSYRTEIDHSTTFDNSWNPKMTYTQISTCDLFDSNAFGKVCHRGQQEWLRRTFKALANAVDLDAVAEYYLAFEWHCNPTGAAKAAKAILKKRSSSLRLYNAYALIESRSGNKAEANRVFSTALGLSTQLGHDAQKMAILLWRTWIWEALREDDVAAVRHRVSSIGDAKPTPELPASTEESQDFSPSTLLKVRRALAEGRDHSLSTNEPMLAVQYTECLAVLEYFHSQLDIAAALDPFHYLSKQLESRKLLVAAAHEAAHQAKYQLVTHHAQRTKLFKPSILREELQKSVALFPDNTRFLSLYASHEARFRIDDRLRAILQDVVLSEKRIGGGGGSNSGPSIIAWHFSIHSEIARSRAAVAVGAGSSSGISHAVRAAFEKALADDAVGSKSAALWSSYVVYLARQLGDAQAAKAAFFRGLLRLPFAKHYVLLAFEVLGEEVLGFRDARSVYNTLHEKELRVRVDIDAELDRVERAAEERRARDLLVQQDDFERS
ncbi:NRDE-2, necessary for RNA interference-domain-containing protein [Phyllosticta citriasiana]|uniref:NRDE-2, necessary for RNA interference-domain-containing protein n=1 Tax=Phyllosticta citriasiana TaxID=595635 RepID=UPI0030FD761B